MAGAALRIGLNPYGLTYTVGLQGAGTPRANPDGVGLPGFIEIAREIGAACVEVDSRWVVGATERDLTRTREAIQALGAIAIYSCWLAHTPGETLADHVRAAALIGARLIRMHLSPVLEGARAAWGADWTRFVAHARTTLIHEAPRAADAGLALAIEDHQDFGSEELVAMAEDAGDHVGIVFDTGNPFAVGEDPAAFAKRVAARVRHVHLKDYRAQFTAEGYRLVRCAIGDGSVPFGELVSLLGDRGAITASIEPGALEARHIRAFVPGWWKGYPPRRADEFATAIGRLRQRAFGEEDDVRTPWEQEAPGAAIVQYERTQLLRSVDHLRALGWM
jgi:sugar phosphate isomerase/epimerase